MAPSAPSRRTALAALASLASLTANAQTGAGRPLHPGEIIVPAAPGGPLGVTAVILAEAMNRYWHQRVALQHTSGAVTGALAVARSPSDGSHVGMSSPALSINAALRASLPFSTLSDLAPVCQLGNFEYGIFANPSLSVNNVAELVVYAQTVDGPLRYASPGVGTGSHLAAESFAYEAGLKLVHVPFPSNGAAEKAVLSGHVPVLFNGLSASVAATRRQPLRLVGLMGSRRVADAAGVSSVAQVLPGFELTGTLGMIAPKGVPFGVVRRLGQDIATLVMQPDVRQRLADVGVEAVASSPDEYESLLRADIARWRLVGRITKVRLLG